MQIRTPTLTAGVREALKGAVGRRKNKNWALSLRPPNSEAQSRSGTACSHKLSSNAEPIKSCHIASQVGVSLQLSSWKPTRAGVCIREMKRNVFHLRWLFYSELRGYLTSLRPILPPSSTHHCIGVLWLSLLLYFFNSSVESKNNNYTFLNYNGPSHVSPTSQAPYSITLIMASEMSVP